MSGVRLDRGLASFRNGCYGQKSKHRVNWINTIVGIKSDKEVKLPIDSTNKIKKTLQVWMCPFRITNATSFSRKNIRLLLIICDHNLCFELFAKDLSMSKWALNNHKTFKRFLGKKELISWEGRVPILMSCESVGFFYLQQLSSWSSFLHVHLQAAGQEGSEDRRQLLRTLQLRSSIGGD